MKLRLVAIIATLGMLIVLFQGCTGQPRVTVLTSTMVGLEAKPPMGDAQPNPSVSLAYKRAEMMLVPVCHVEEYGWWRSFKARLGVQGKKNGEKPDPANAHGPHPTGEIPYCPPKGSPDADVYAVAGSFQMEHNWFGPLNIRQFITTGMAARHLANPIVHRVQVIGEVKKPGQYRFTKGLKAIDALGLAGGKTENADDTPMKVLREGKSDESIEDSDPVSPEDTILVPPKQWFTITGEVKNSDRYPMSGQLTGSQAIEKAGGYSQNAAKDKSFLRRKINGQDVILMEIENITVLPDDFIHVPAKPEESTGDAKPKSMTSEQIPETFSIGGAVKKPGSYPYSKGLTVRRAIELAGGRVGTAT
ncbi:MAG: SLBB domain-containing protein, partial [Nitrospira sp.]